MIVVNPLGGGGLSNAKLALADAAADDVLAGKKFYSGSKELQTGTNTTKPVLKTFLSPPANGSQNIEVTGYTHVVISTTSRYSVNSDYESSVALYQNGSYVAGGGSSTGGSVTMSGNIVTARNNGARSFSVTIYAFTP